MAGQLIPVTEGVHEIRLGLSRGTRSSGSCQVLACLLAGVWIRRGRTRSEPPEPV